MGTASGAATRRYHGWLVAAIKPPTHRMVLLAGAETTVLGRGAAFELGCNQYGGAVHPEGHRFLESFRAGRFVEWVWKGPHFHLRRRLTLTLGENTATVEMANLGSEPLHLSMRPLVCHKDYHGNFRSYVGYPDAAETHEGLTVIRHGDVPLYLHHPGFETAPSAGWYYRFERQIEKERGLDPVEDLYAPVELSCLLDGGAKIVFTASTEERPRLGVFEDSGDWSLRERLENSARHFLIDTPERASIIAGYPWFTDWGRDTMIALPGVALEIGETEHAKRILRSYASQMKEGLLPNRFVDAGEEPDSNTVDATLWFAWAIHQTLMAEWDGDLAEEAAGWLEEVYHWHVEGTKFGIRVDPEDGLLTQGGEGLQLTWMDAKIGDWVVTPRTGKPVEICALWVNLLRTLEWLCVELGRDGLVYRLAADKAESNFEGVFWRDSLGHYMDVAQPDDGSLRPNMVLAMALPFSPAKGPKAVRSLQAAERELLTPRGLRTLAPGEMGFRPRWEGDMKARDAAYHQGTVWPWLLGFYILACHRLGVDHGSALGGLEEMSQECGLGGISEVYDATAPQRPGGCPWQAWSVGSALMALRVTEKAV